jgi:mRNA interferase MazF
MEGSLDNYRKGDVVIVPFPFTDHSTAKRRPAFIIAKHKEDFIVLLITSKENDEAQASKITAEDFSEGSLEHISYVKTHRIFTLDRKLILKKAGTLTARKVKEIQDRVVFISNA